MRRRRRRVGHDRNVDARRRRRRPSSTKTAGVYNTYVNVYNIKSTTTTTVISLSLSLSVILSPDGPVFLGRIKIRVTLSGTTGRRYFYFSERLCVCRVFVSNVLRACAHARSCDRRSVRTTKDLGTADLSRRRRDTPSAVVRFSVVLKRQCYRTRNGNAFLPCPSRRKPLKIHTT